LPHSVKQDYLLIIMKKIVFLIAIACYQVCYGQNPADIDSVNSVRFKKLSAEYHSGVRDYAQMPFMIEMADKRKDARLSGLLVKDYINDYLLKLPDSLLYTSANIRFIANHIYNAQSAGFLLFKDHSEQIDRIMNKKDLSRDVVKSVITREFIDSLTALNVQNPTWTAISKQIIKGFGKDIADEVILNIQLRWFSKKKEWEKYSAVLVRQTEKYAVPAPYGLAFSLNNIAWDIFQHTNNKSLLRKALAWSEEANKLSNQSRLDALDTKANLLYKLGKTEEAIKVETRVTEIDPNFKDGQENLKKMKNGEKTWPEL